MGTVLQAETERLARDGVLRPLFGFCTAKWPGRLPEKRILLEGRAGVVNPPRRATRGPMFYCEVCGHRHYSRCVCDLHKEEFGV